MKKTLTTLALLTLSGSALATPIQMDSFKLGSLKATSQTVCADFPVPAINARVQELQASVELNKESYDAGFGYAVEEQKLLEKGGMSREDFCTSFEHEVSEGKY